LKGAFNKFDKWLTDFETMSLREAHDKIDWEKTKVILL